jgi:hypothetical protein
VFPFCTYASIMHLFLDLSARLLSSTVVPRIRLRATPSRATLVTQTHGEAPHVALANADILVEPQDANSRDLPRTAWRYSVRRRQRALSIAGSRTMTRPSPKPDTTRAPLNFKLSDAAAPVNAPLAYRKRSAALLLDISVRTMERLLAAGQFPKPDAYAGRCPLWTRPTLESWLSQGGGSMVLDN